MSVPKKPCKCLWHYPASSWGRRDDGTVVNRRVADREKEAFQTTPQFQPGGKIALSRFLLLTLLKLLWHCPYGFIGADSDPDCRHQNLVLVSFQTKVNFQGHFNPKLQVFTLISFVVVACELQKVSCLMYCYFTSLKADKRCAHKHWGRRSVLLLILTHHFPGTRCSEWS